jgi:hypothetical protein
LLGCDGGDGCGEGGELGADLRGVVGWRGGVGGRGYGVCVGRGCGVGFWVGGGERAEWLFGVHGEEAGVDGCDEDCVLVFW